MRPKQVRWREHFFHLSPLACAVHHISLPRVHTNENSTHPSPQQSPAPSDARLLLPRHPPLRRISPEKNMKFPKLSNPVKTREDGTKVLGGLTGREWAITMFALVSLWIVQAFLFTALLAAATAVRDGRGLLPRPGREICLYSEPGCTRVNPIDIGS